MYYPEDMTREDIISFELDMAALTIREEMETANWLLMEAAEVVRASEIEFEFVCMVAELVGVPAILKG